MCNVNCDNDKVKSRCDKCVEKNQIKLFFCYTLSEYAKRRDKRGK